MNPFEKILNEFRHVEWDWNPDNVQSITSKYVDVLLTDFTGEFVIVFYDLNGAETHRESYIINGEYGLAAEIVIQRINQYITQLILAATNAYERVEAIYNFTFKDINEIHTPYFIEDGTVIDFKRFEDACSFAKNAANELGKLLPEEKTITIQIESFIFTDLFYVTINDNDYMNFMFYDEGIYGMFYVNKYETSVQGKDFKGILGRMKVKVKELLQTIQNDRNYLLKY